MDVAGATLGNVWIGSQLLRSGIFAWGVVQHEYAHQVDFGLLTTQMRAVLQPVLGAAAWCYNGYAHSFHDVEGLPSMKYGCERFASMIAWAYWHSPDNSMDPIDIGMYAPLDPAKFRALLRVLLAPDYATLSTTPDYPGV